jgi:sarcosine oxidase
VEQPFEQIVLVAFAGHADGKDTTVTKVAVVGAGVMGCAVAWALTERGADVTLHEQFDDGHTRGSSHGRTRIFRLAYPDEQWVKLAQEAFGAWRELEAASGLELLGLHGLVELCSSVEVSSREVLAANGIEQRLLAGDELRERGIEPPNGWIALWQEDAGVVFAEEAIKALRGDVPVERRRIESLDALEADVVVVTAGAWVTKLVPDVPVRVTRETIAYFAHDGRPMPSVVELDDTTRKHAMYALHDPRYGLKAGAHHAGRVADADVDEPADPVLVEQIADWVRSRFPDADPNPIAAESCLYTSTEDESFVLERRGRVVVGSACSGHGFKFAPAVGRRLAALALS